MCDHLCTTCTYKGENLLRVRSLEYHNNGRIGKSGVKFPENLVFYIPSHKWELVEIIHIVID